MVKPVAFAHALTAVLVAAFLICAIWINLAPDSFWLLLGSWFHGIDLESIAPQKFNFGVFLIGLVTYSASIWVGSYFAASFYNKLAK